MRDERSPPQLFDLIARDWVLPVPATGLAFNADDTAVAFACGDGSIHMATTADKQSPASRVKRAVDTGRLTIAPRGKPHLPLKVADFTAGRSTPVVPHGPTHFAFGKADGRINRLTPGGLAHHLPARIAGPVSALASSSDGDLLAVASGASLYLCAADADAPVRHDLPSDASALAFSPDGRVLAVSMAAALWLWPVAGPMAEARQTELDGVAASVSWRADGAWLTVCLVSGGFCVIESAGGTVQHHGNFPAPVRSAGFGLASGTVVASGAFRVAAWTLPGHVDVLTGKAGLVLVDAVATCPSRNLVAVGYANGLLSLAEVGRPSEILLRADTGAGVTAMEWSRNGRFLALAGADGSAALVEFPDEMFKS